MKIINLNYYIILIEINLINERQIFKNDKYYFIIIYHIKRRLHADVIYNHLSEFVHLYTRDTL